MLCCLVVVKVGFKKIKSIESKKIKFEERNLTELTLKINEIKTYIYKLSHKTNPLLKNLNFCNIGLVCDNSYIIFISFLF